MNLLRLQTLSLSTKQILAFDLLCGTKRKITLLFRKPVAGKNALPYLCNIRLFLYPIANIFLFFFFLSFLLFTDVIAPLAWSEDPKLFHSIQIVSVAQKLGAYPERLSTSSCTHLAFTTSRAARIVMITLQSITETFSQA